MNRPAAPARSRSRSHSGSPWADRLVADTNPIDAVQFFKKLSKEKRHVVSRLSTSILVKYFEFLGVDTTSMSRSELIEELLLQVDRVPLLADLEPIDWVQGMQKLDEDDPGDMRHVVSRLSTSSLVKYGEFLEIDTTSMSREELIEELIGKPHRVLVF